MPRLPIVQLTASGAACHLEMCEHCSPAVLRAQSYLCWHMLCAHHSGWRTTTRTAHPSQSALLMLAGKRSRSVRRAVCLP